MGSSAEAYAKLSALLVAGQGGDVASYQRFLQQIAPYLRRAVGRRLPASDVEDVVQEILISIHKARHTFDGARPLMPWVMAIAQFRIIDHLRKHYASARQVTVDIDTLADVLPDVTATADSNESIDVLLESVPERERRILTMMHVDGFTAKETGAAMGMKESAVKVAAHRALKKLREKLSA